MTPFEFAHRSPVGWPTFWQWMLFYGARIIAIIFLLLAGTALVYHTGGTSYAYPYVMLIPVLLAAAWFHITGGVVAAIAAGLLIGPYMPLAVSQGIFQETSNWVLRLALYAALGAFAGNLFRRLALAVAARERAVRTHTGSGLLNAIALMDDLQCLLCVADKRRSGLALVLAHITDMGEILSGVGADGADTLLSRISQNLNKHLGDNAVIYHFGPSELMIRLLYCSPVELEKQLERIRAVAEQTVTIHAVPVRAEVGLGVSTAESKDVLDGKELVRRARIAVFAAVETQKPYCFYKQQQEKATEDTIRQIARVHRALQSEEFELHYQPKIRLLDGSIAGCEGLIRWRHNGELILPGAFMPKVERTTLITPVTRFVTLKAAEFIHLHPDVPLSVNFTVRNLLDETLLQWLHRLVAEQNIPPGALEIEITESALIQDPEAAKQIIADIRSWGIGVLLDDFGTGYSSFAYLRELPISGLKIDRAFVRDLEVSPAARKLLGCMVDVAHALELTVTAEGVETPAQRDVLRGMGCDLAQGFLFGRAMSTTDYVQWSQNYRASIKQRSA